MVEEDKIFPKEKVEKVEVHADGSKCCFPYCNLPHTEYEAVYERKVVKRIING